MAEKSKFAWDEKDAAGLVIEKAGSNGVAAALAEVDRTLMAAGAEDEVDDEAEPLYVSRPVLNADEILRWARAAGIKNLNPPEKLHVTIVYAEAPVDWLSFAPDEVGLELPADSGRAIEVFGEKLVLTVHDPRLTDRNAEFGEGGAIHSFTPYRAHVTLALADGQDASLQTIPVYAGKILLGPEIFAVIEN